MAEGVSTCVVSLDAASTIDIYGLQEYIKANFKQDFVFLDAFDYLGPAIKSSDSLSYEDLVKATTLNIAKTMNKVIDAEISRYIEAQKKLQAAIDKAKANPKAQMPVIPPKLFGGNADICFCILNFPFVPLQYEILAENGINISSFIQLTGSYSRAPSKVQDNRSNSRVSTKSKSSQKTSSMPYSSMIGKVTTKHNTPARWEALKPYVDPKVIFTTLKAEGDAEQIFSSLQTEIGRIIFEGRNLQEKYNDVTYNFIPYLDVGVPIDIYKAYLQFYPADYVNALYAQLFDHKTGSEIDESDPKLLELFNMFDMFAPKATPKPKEPTLPNRYYNIEYPKTFDLQKAFSNWTVTDKNTFQIEKSSEFYANLENFAALAGSKFDLLVNQTNKRNGFGLPLSFFDFAKWDHQIEYSYGPPILSEAINRSAIVETLYDEAISTLFILIIPPVQRTMGKPIRHNFMPITSEGFSDFYKELNQGEQTPQTNNRAAPTPAMLLRKHESATSLFGKLSSSIEKCKNVYRMNARHNISSDFISPYFLTTGTQININRAILKKHFTFSYRTWFRDTAFASSTHDSVSVDTGTARITLTLEPFFATIICGDLSLTFNREILRIEGPRSFAISSKGDLLLGGGSYIIASNGYAGHKSKDGSWYWTDSEGNCKRNNEKQKSIPFATNIHDKTKTFIRDDNIRYVIRENITRCIDVDSEDATVEQSGDTIIYQVGDLSFLYTISKGEIAFEMAETSFRLTSENLILRKNDNFECIFSDTGVSIKTDKEEAELLPRTVQIRTENAVFYADSKGAEVLGTIIDPNVTLKKNAEYVESKWGKIQPTKEQLTEPQQNELNLLFQPRFFALRSDMSLSEFVHRDLIPKSIVRESKDRKFMAVISEMTVKIAATKHTDLDKQHRSAVIKRLVIPKRGNKKPKKGEPIPDPEEEKKRALDAQSNFIKFFKDLRCEIRTVSSEILSAYEDEIRPPPPPPPEKYWIPPQTPPPRLQRAVNKKYVESGDSFFDSPEAVFYRPYEVIFKKPRPPSSRTRLFDPPRAPRTTADNPPEVKEEFQVYEPTAPSTKNSRRKHHLRMPSRDGRTPRRIVGRAADVDERLQGQTVDFGDVIVGREASASLSITNTSGRPLSYAFRQSSHPAISVDTPPGKVLPGQKIKVKVRLLSDEPGQINTSFRFFSESLDMEIAVHANVLMQ